MVKNILLRYSVLISILLVQACDCGGNPEVPIKKLTPKPNSDPKPDPNPGDKPGPEQPIANWDLTGNIYKAGAKINATDNWLHQLGIDKTKKETVVINASNPSIKFPGGGIDGALGDWAGANHTTPWRHPAPILPDGSFAPDRLEAGKFGLFPVSFGYIYLAVGPQASQTKTLAKTKELIANLYYHILSQAKEDNMKCVVLCAISTAIFASDGKEADTGKKFVRDEFISNIYEGMKQGIGKFQHENPKHALKIILNNWDDKVVNQAKQLTK
ncbi:MAG: hypothetical protein BGO68_04260 [Candidatus Amoebophilus sp. 36-38]|nr:MAG: hypothetical protein BGO68_04260 [Candidatus Amoebophilus sp. 36-38]